MVIMGGGPGLPLRDSSREKELVLCALPWPDEDAKKSIELLKEEFKDVEVEYFYTKAENAKIGAIEIPEGVY